VEGVGVNPEPVLVPSAPAGLDGSTGCQGIDVDEVVDALQASLPAILKAQAGAGHEIPDGARHEHFAGGRLARHARTDVHRYPTKLAVRQLAFSGVDACANVQAEVSKGVDDRSAAANRPGGPIE
jgi:hypothetical protein